MSQSQPAKHMFIYALSEETHKHKVKCYARVCVHAHLFPSLSSWKVWDWSGVCPGEFPVWWNALWSGRMWQLWGLTLWCQWSDWGWLAARIYSEYCSVVWCGDSEGSVHRCVEDVAPPACGWTCSPLTCRWTLPHFGINSCACHKWLWSLDTKKKNKSCLLSCKHVINFWYCLSRKAQEILEIMSNSSNSSNTVTGSMLNSIVQLSNDLCSNGKICIWCIPGYVCEIYSVFSLFCFHIASTSVTFTFSLCLTTHLPSPPTHRPTSSIFVLPIPFLRCCSSPAVCLSKMGILYVLRKIV